MTRDRDLFFAIVLSGMALVGCSSTPGVEDAGDEEDAGPAIADAGPVLDAQLEDAGEDAMVLIL